MPSEDEEFEFRHRLEQEWAAAAGSEKPKQSNLSAGDQGKLGMADAALSLGTGAIAAPISGYAGMLGAALPGPEGQGAKWQKATQEALTYQPRTEHGRSVANAIGYLPQKLMDIGNAAGEATAETDLPLAGKSPAVGAGVATAINMIPAIVSRGARPLAQRGMTNVSRAASRNAVNDATAAAAQAEGYVMPETTNLAGKMGTMAGGKAATKQDMSNHNAQATDRIARREAGLREDEPITPQALRAQRDVMAAPYRELRRLDQRIGALGHIDLGLGRGTQTMRIGAEMDRLEVVRNDAQAYWREYNGPNHPVRARDEARRLDAEATQIEDRMEQIAGYLKRPDLVQQMRQARVALAKNYQVQGALNLGDGHVDARYLGARYDQGAMMTGGLETIARFALGPGKTVTMEPAAVGFAGVTHGTALTSALGAYEGYKMGGLTGAVIGGAIPLARVPARGLALSRFGQRTAGTTPGTGLRLMDIGSRPAATGAAALTPGLGLQPPREEY